MMTDEKLLIMFDLAQEQQQMVKDLINDTKELQRIVESKTYASIQTTAKAVGELSTSEVKSNIEKYEKSLESLLAKTVQVNQQLENATQRFNYKTCRDQETRCLWDRYMQVITICLDKMYHN